MRAREKDELGYAFALPRLIAHLAGRQVRRAEFSAAEAYGLGLLVFAMGCIGATRALHFFVRPGLLRLLGLLFLPVAVWFAFLPFYYVISLLARMLRRLQLYSAPTNKPFQHRVFMSFFTLLAALFVRDGDYWIRSLGIFWLVLVSLNLLSLMILRLRHER